MSYVRAGAGVRSLRTVPELLTLLYGGHSSHGKARPTLHRPKLGLAVSQVKGLMWGAEVLYGSFSTHGMGRKHQYHHPNRDRCQETACPVCRGLRAPDHVPQASKTITRTLLPTPPYLRKILPPSLPADSSVPSMSGALDRDPRSFFLPH